MKRRRASSSNEHCTGLRKTKGALARREDPCAREAGVMRARTRQHQRRDDQRWRGGFIRTGAAARRQNTYPLIIDERAVLKRRRATSFNRHCTGLRKTKVHRRVEKIHVPVRPASCARARQHHRRAYQRWRRDLLRTGAASYMLQRRDGARKQGATPAAARKAGVMRACAPTPTAR